MNPSQRILLTGATGFLGSFILNDLVKNGYHVSAVARKPGNLEQIRIAFDFKNQNSGSFDDFLEKVDWRYADLSTPVDFPELLNGIDVIIHCAAQVSFDRKNRESIYSVNVEGTTNLVNAAIEHGISEFHFVSSIASLNRNEKGMITEEFSYEMMSFGSIYSRSKFLSEMEVIRGYQEGLKGVIINPGVIIGPAIASHDISAIFKMIKNGFNWYPGGSNGYVDVRDVSEMLIQLSSDSKYFGERFLLVSESITYKDLFGMIAKGFGIAPPERPVSGKIARLFSVLDWGRSLLTGKKQIITRDLVNLVNSHYVFDHSKIVNALARDFRKISDSVSDSCEFIKDFEKNNGI